MNESYTTASIRTGSDGYSPGSQTTPASQASMLEEISFQLAEVVNDLLHIHWHLRSNLDRIVGDTEACDSPHPEDVRVAPNLHNIRQVLYSTHNIRDNIKSQLERFHTI